MFFMVANWKAETTWPLAETSWVDDLQPYILKVGLAGCKNPQMILIFPQRDCLRTRKVSRLHCLQSLWRSFPLFMFSHCNKLSIKTLKHTIFSTTMPHWHQILVIFMIYALLSRFVLSQFTHFFRRSFETEKQNPQTLSPLEGWMVQNDTKYVILF